MAHSFADVKRFKRISGIRSGIINMTVGAAYATGGFTVTAANLGLEALLDLKCPVALYNGHATPVSHLMECVRSSATTWKIRAWTAIDTELANANNDFDSIVIRLEYKGY